MTSSIMDGECVCEGNWCELVNQYHNSIGGLYEDRVTNQRYILEGLLHGSDDFYFAMKNVSTNQFLFLSCVGELEVGSAYINHGFIKKDF